VIFKVVGNVLDGFDIDSVEIVNLQDLIRKSEPVVIREILEVFFIDERVLGIVELSFLVTVVVLIRE
jgi:hypothetical protein